MSTVRVEELKDAVMTSQPTRRDFLRTASAATLAAPPAQQPAYADEASPAAQVRVVMPKGRNFH